MICIIVKTVTMTNSPYFQFSLSSSIPSPFIWLCIQIQAACDSRKPWLHNFHAAAFDSSFTSPHKTLGTQQCIKPFCYTSRRSSPRCSNVLPLAAFKWKGCVQQAKTRLHLFPESVFIPWVWFSHGCSRFFLGGECLCVMVHARVMLSLHYCYF